MAAMVTAGGGLLLGKFKEKDYIAQLYRRQDFTLLDSQGNFFQLAKFPEEKLLLLVFTPDGIHPVFVKAFRELSSHLKELSALDVEVMLITRTSREIARNFKEAAQFQSTLLLDPSGTVGRNIGIWPSPEPVNFWGYALIDNRLQVYWTKTNNYPLNFAQIMTELRKLSASMKTSNGSP